MEFCVETGNYTYYRINNTFLEFLSIYEHGVTLDGVAARLRQQHRLKQNTGYEYSTEFKAWLNFTLAVSNSSLTYQLCLNASDENIVRLYDHIAAYESLSNYLLYGIPNLLSYSFIFNTWMDQIDVLKERGDNIGLAYLYAVIARKLVFYDIKNVTLAAEDELPDDFDNIEQANRLQRKYSL